VNSLPATLNDYRARLEAAAARDLSRRRRTRTVVFSIIVTLGAVALVSAVFSSAGFFRGHGPSIVERASAALSVSDGTILHVAVVGEQRNGDGTESKWRDESWQSTSKPYERRQVEQVGVGPTTETGSVGDAEALYEAATNTIYVRTEPAALPVTGKVLRWKNAQGKTHRVIVMGGRPAPPKTETDPIEEPFRREVLELLRSGDAHEAGRLRFAGRDAIRIVGNDGARTYFVDAKTYDPIEFRTRGTGGSTSLRFVVYEALPLTASTRPLLSVEAQHSGAMVRHDAAAFQAAENRLFPHG
jgi:hypothetical protein